MVQTGAKSRTLLARGATGLGCALLTGLLLVLALPLGERYYLGWIMLWPLLRVTRNRGFLWGFVLALASIFAAAGLADSGLFYAVKSSAGNPNWIYTTFGIFGFSLALAVGIWSDASSAAMKAWWFAALGVLLEAILLLGLPAHLALTQYRQSPMLLVASVGGIWLVSYLVWWSNFALATLEPRRALLFGAIVVGASIAGSKVHFSANDRLLRFGVIQIEEPDEDRMALAQRKLSSEGAVLSVWPEFGGIPFVSTGATDRLASLSGGPNGSAFVTSFEDDYHPLPHNAAAVFEHGTESTLYFKRQLFGGEEKMHTAGTRAVAADFDGGRVGLNICFDSCYPNIIRDTARLPGVDVIALPSTDPIAPNSFVAGMHAAYGSFRSAENGVALVKADGAAYSTFVDPYGQIVAQLAQGDGTLTAEVSTAPRQTIYKRFGDWFLWLVGAMVLGGMPAKRRRSLSKHLPSTQA